MSDEATPTTPIREGEVLAGKYLVEKVLGVGGMGVVVAARHLQLETKVAIKFLLPEMLGNATVVARFAREARAAVKITNEHVARVLDVGTLQTGAPYMVMEFLDGGDLASWLQRGPLPIDQAVDFVLQASVAVADAHGLGIVHRDLKPANLFCVRRTDGQLQIKVLDFGISKMTETDRGVAMTGTTSVMGSPLYMSPEQMQTPKEVDGQTDIWALGVILYELLTGRVPFNGQTYADVAIKVGTQPPAPITEFRPDLPEGLQAVVLKCLAKPKADRFRNVGQLAVALAPYAPRHARQSVERVTRIVQAAGLSASALDLPPSPRIDQTGPAPGATAPVAVTAHAISGTSPGTKGGGSKKTFAGIAAAIAVSVGATVVVMRAGTKVAPEASSTATVSAAAAMVPPSVSQAAPPPAASLVLPPPDTAVRAEAPVEPAEPVPSASASAAHPATALGNKKTPVSRPVASAAAPPAKPEAAAPPDSDPLSRLRFKP